jgi:hypothetical protein
MSAAAAAATHLAPAPLTWHATKHGNDCASCHFCLFLPFLLLPLLLLLPPLTQHQRH